HRPHRRLVVLDEADAGAEEAVVSVHELQIVAAADALRQRPQHGGRIVGRRVGTLDGQRRVGGGGQRRSGQGRHFRGGFRPTPYGQQADGEQNTTGDSVVFHGGRTFRLVEVSGSWPALAHPNDDDRPVFHRRLRSKNLAAPGEETSVSFVCIMKAG